MESKERKRGSHRRAKWEFSKKITWFALIAFCVLIGLSMITMVFMRESAHSVVSLISASVPVFIVIFTGYFGKAGVENYTKIRAEAECDPPQRQEPSSSNG